MRFGTVKNTIGALGAVALLMPGTLLAQKRMNFDNFTTSDGLSSNLVYSLAEDSLGHVWVGTDFGLNCFDGTVFKSYPKKQYPQLYRNDIGHLACLPSGHVMMGGGNGFLAVYDGKIDRFSDVAPANYDSSYQKTVTSFCLSQTSGRFLAATSNGIYEFSHKQYRFLPQGPLYKNTEPFSIDAMSSDTRGRYWILTDGSMVVYREDGKEVFNQPIGNDEQHAIISSIYPVSPSLMVAYGLADRLSFYSIAANGEVGFSHHVLLPFRNVRNFVRAKNGSFWFITDGDGLWMSKGVPTQMSDFQKVLPYGANEEAFSKLYAVMVDRSGDLWVGSQNSGLWRLRLNHNNGIFTATELGLANCMATGFADLKDGRHLVASDGIGIFSYSDHNPTPFLYGPSNGLTNKNVTSVLNDGLGRIWVTTWGGGLYSSPTDNIHFTNIPFTGINSPRSNLFSVVRLVNGDYWVCAGGDGIYVLHNGQWSLKLLQHPNYGDAPDRWPYFVVEASSSLLWIFTSTTVWIDNNGVVAPIKVHYHGSSKDQMISIHDACFVPNYGVLAATNNGLLLFKADGSAYSKLNYCPSSYFSSVLLAADGAVWASGTEGIVKVDLKAQKCVSYPFDFSSKGQNYFKIRSKIVDSNGRIYFGNRDGFFSFNPNTSVMDMGVGHVGISRLLINGEPVTFDYEDAADPNSEVLAFYGKHECGNWKTYGNGGELNLGYGETNLDIQFDVVDFNECSSRLFYRLNGLYDSWTMVPADKNFNFSYIPSGSYTLELAMQSGLGADYKTLYSLSILVSPPWWATWWFRLLLLALVVGLVYRRYRNVVREKIVLQEKVNERTLDLKTKNQLIEKRNSELNRVLSYKDRLIAVVAHDLKNPMFAIVGALEGLLRKDASMNPEERQKVVGDVLGSARTLQTEMSKLLAWATSSQDDIEYRPSNTDLAQIIDSDLALLKATADGKGVKVLSEVNVRNYCYIDARMVSTVIRNVVSNSIKFTPSGKAVSLKAWQEHDRAKIQISDQGVGMTAEKIKELQTEGRHTSTEGTQGEKGTGLGVSIVRDYVLQNNGTFNIESTLGVGTTTTITLPLTDVELVESQLSPVKTVPDFEVDTELMSGNTVLVVDDDPLICQNIKNMLDAYVSVLVANNGRQALELMAQNAIDIVVSDVEMPVMNGIDMSIELSKNEALNYIPILFLSAKSSESDRLLGLLTGAIDYIPKPFSQNELLIKLNNILSLRQKQQQRLLSEHIANTTSVGADDHSEAGADVWNDAQTADPVAEGSPVVDGQKQEQINPLLREMLDVIEKHYTDNTYSVERLADDMCMTKITLYRRVKTLSGQTPVELLNEFRLQKAMALLKEGNIQVGDVAFQVGFSDPAYFTRRFRNFFNFPPSAVKPNR